MLPDWRNLDRDAGVVREATPDSRRIVFWLTRGSEKGCRQWERIANVPGTEVTAGQALCAVAATSVRASQQVLGLFGELFGLRRLAAESQTWLLPNGEVAEQQGERRTDLLLVWAEDENAFLDEARVRSRWPQAKETQRLGKSLFLVSGVQLPGAQVAGEGALPTDHCPRQQVEQLLATARQAGDRRREALALNDLGVLATKSGDARPAVALLEGALGLAVRLDDPVLEADVRGNLGLARLGSEPPARGLELLQQSLAQHRAAADRLGEKAALERLGTAFSRLRDPGRALPWYAQALALARDLGDRRHEAELQWEMAIQHADLGQRDPALAQGQAAVDLLAAMRHPHAGWFAENLRRYRAGAGNAGLGEAGVFPDPSGGAASAVQALAPQRGPWPAAGQVTGPGLLRLAFSAAKSMAKFLTAGLPTVSAEARRQRLAACGACAYHTGLRCRVCGCFTGLKSRLAHETCPAGQWPTE